MISETFLEAFMKGTSLFKLTGRQVKGIQRIQRMAKKQGDCRLLQRCHSVLMLSRGLSPDAVASMLSVHLNSVRGWMRRVQQNGVSGLLDKKYPGAVPKLDASQREKLISIVESGPETYGLETGVWTSPLIKEVILKEFGVKYHVSQVRRILNSLGFTVQYPRIRLSKADAEKQKTWIRETLPAIKKRLQKRTGF